MKIRTRITLATIMLVVITTGLMGYTSISHLTETLDAETTNWSSAISRAVAKAITADTIAGNKVSVREILKNVTATNNELAYIMVIDFKGEVFTSTFDKSIPSIVSSDHSSEATTAWRTISLGNKEIREVSFPLIEGLDAHLHIGLDSNAISSHITHAAEHLIIYAIIFIIIFSIAAIALGQSIGQPINKLAQRLTSYGRGRADFNITDAAASSLEELNALSTSFEQMIHERKNTDYELQQIKYTLDQTLDCVFMFDADTLNFFYVNQGAMDQVGYHYDEMLQMTPFDIKPDYDEASFKKMIAPFLNKEIESCTFTTRHQHKDGHIIPVEIFLQYISIKDQARFIAVVRDISERIDNEKKLQQINEELEQRVEERTAKVKEQAIILNQIHDSVISTDLNGFITNWNKGAERLFGFTSDEAIGKNISFLYPEDQLDTLTNDVIKPLLNHGEHETEVIMLNKAGERFSAHLSLSLLRNKDGEPIGMIGYSLDITERKKADEELRKTRDLAEKASRSKTEFLSRMSHELRTPMNAILGFGQLLEQNVTNNLTNNDLDAVGEILRGGYHLLDLINEVLDLSRVESGKLKLSIEDVDLCPLITETITLIQPLADKSGISINFSDHSKDFVIHADRLRLKQVILNLLSNAVKYNCKNGHIDIRCEDLDNTIRLSVKDTGPGIPVGLQDRVFEPFDRLDADTSEIEGTGIGLSLAKRLIEFMHGSIGFDSTENQGTTFWIEIKSGDTLSDQVIEVDNIVNHQTIDGEYKVLYVEDNPANLRLVSRIFNSMDEITLHDAHSASLAMDIIQTHTFDLILLDIHLSGEESGYDILHKLRAEPITKNIPVVAISANATPHDIKHGLASGFDEYITKPIDVPHFINTVHRFLTKS